MGTSGSGVNPPGPAQNKLVLKLNGKVPIKTHQ
jgi:hypothetical protein